MIYNNKKVYILKLLDMPATKNGNEIKFNLRQLLGTLLQESSLIHPAEIRRRENI